MLKTLLRVCLPTVFALSSCSTPSLDQYGGDMSRTFTEGSNGYFRTAKDAAGRWWLVTPDNHAFLSYGLNHFHAMYFSIDENKKFFEKKFGGEAGSPEWGKGFGEYANNLLESFGMNTLGYHNDACTFAAGRHPYIQQYSPLNIDHYKLPTAADFTDIFADEYEAVCDREARKNVLPHVTDKMLIGYAMADLPTTTQMWARQIEGEHPGYDCPTWPRFLRNLPPKAPGKRAYVAAMKEYYDGDIKAFNKTYSTRFGNWNELLNSEDWRTDVDYDNARETEDNNRFGMVCMDRYYGVAYKYLRKYDKNHLFLGDKQNGNMQVKSEMPLILNTIGKYLDVIYYQSYGDLDYMKALEAQLVEDLDLPIFNGDGGYQYGAPDMEKNAKWQVEYARAAFSNPHFVGFTHCGIIDFYNDFGQKRAAVVDYWGKEHQIMGDALREAASHLYEYRAQ